MKRYYKLIIVILLVAVFVLIGILIARNGKQGLVMQNGNSAATSATPIAPATSSPSGAVRKTGTTSLAPTSPIGKISPSSPARPVISFIRPVAGDAWKIATYNPISWTVAPGVTGYIYLVDAQSGNFVGVITPQIGAQQVSYSWNTRDLLLSRTSPLKKDVTPGNYIIEIAFDANHLSIIASPAFTIAQ